MSELCKFLPWDSEHFGKRIAQVTATTVTAETLFDIIDWCSGEKIDCLYFLADLDDKTAELVRREGFQMVDIRVTLDQSLDHVIPCGSFEVAKREYIPALQRLARFEESRFHHDHFFRVLAEKMFETWIEQAVIAGNVLMSQPVLEPGETVANSVPSGYVVCTKQNDLGRIELLGVAEEWRGKGLGEVLTEAALSWLAHQDCKRVSVVTQGRNIAAQRLYQRAGFRTQSVQVWYHKWFHV